MPSSSIANSTDAKHLSSAKLIPFVDLSWQHRPLQSDILAVVEQVLAKGDYVLGQGVADFEAAFASACQPGPQTNRQVAYGVGVGCGTDAIALGLRACGVGVGDEVILPANTFVATLIGIVRAGAVPVFVDCEVQTALIDLAAVAQAITPKTRAIVPVHLYGQMVSPSGLLELAKRHDLIILEDSAQAHLAEREGYRAGSVGMAAAFSFYPSKNLGALGDGGMLVTRQEVVAQTVRSLRNYGATRKYFHTDPGGTNSRLDTLQAGVLSLKLPHLTGWNAERNRLAAYYDQAIAPLSDQRPIAHQKRQRTGPCLSPIRDSSHQRLPGRSHPFAARTQQARHSNGHSLPDSVPLTARFSVIGAPSWRLPSFRGAEPGDIVLADVPWPDECAN